MATLDPDMARAGGGRAARATASTSASSTEVRAFEPGVVVTVDGALDADLVVLGIGVAPNSTLAADAGLELGVRKGRSGSTAASGPRPTASGRPATAARAATSCRASTCTSPSAPSPTSSPGWPAPTSAVGTPRSPAWSARPSPRSATPRCPAPGCRRPRRRGPGSWPRPPRSRRRRKAGYYPGAEPMTVRFVVERRHRPAARRPDRGGRRRRHAHRHLRRRHHRRDDRRRDRPARPGLRAAVLVRCGTRCWWPPARRSRRHERGAEHPRPGRRDRTGRAMSAADAPSTVGRRASAPASSSRRAASPWPNRAARCSGVDAVGRRSPTTARRIEAEQDLELVDVAEGGGVEHVEVGAGGQQGVEHPPVAAGVGEAHRRDAVGVAGRRQARLACRAASGPSARRRPAPPRSARVTSP